MRIPIINNIIKYYVVFHGYVGNRLAFLVCLAFLSGISDSFGLSMLLPLLDYDNPAESTGNYAKWIYSLIEFSGLNVSLNSILLFMLVAFSLKGIFTFTQRAIFANITANLIKDVQIKMLDDYTRMKYGYYVNTNIGFLNNLITKEVERAIGAFNKFIDVLVLLVSILLYLSVAFTINYTMTTVVVLLSLTLFLLFRTFSFTLRKLSMFVSKSNASIQATLIQVIYNFKYLKATQSFLNLSKQLKTKIDNLRKAIFRLEIINALPQSLIEPVTVLFLSALIITQVNFLGKHLSESLLLLIFFHRTFTRVFGFQQVWQQFCTFIGGLETVENAREELLHYAEKFEGKYIDCFKNSIVLSNVDCHYGEKRVIQNVNIKIPKNKMIGIVGESGAGKTTLFDLLTGLVTPTSGILEIDGIDYKQLNISSLRKLMGYVTQEPVIFNDTVSNNISFWQCDSNNEECIDRINIAAELSNCTSFINEMSEGFDTIIGDKGIKLSGGQCQRIAIAREIFKNPQIMIFDEATSSLDTESEIFIQNSIENMSGKCTILIIAHRLSTIKDCDYIYVLSKGRVVEEGSFEELFNLSNGTFRKMCIAQQF